MGRRGLILALVAVASTVPGCATRAALRNVVLEYDEAVARAHAEMLVLNVARARRGRPLHFTTVSGIAATFEYRVDASVRGDLAEAPGIDLLAPAFGISASESPTISIVPLQGEEFARRLLAPLEESRLAYFVHQEVDLGLLLRLLAHGVIVESADRRRMLTNAVDHPDGHAAFGEVVGRLAALDARGELDIGPLVFDESWPIRGLPAPSVAELAGLLDRGYRVHDDAGAASLVRRVIGRTLIADYDPLSLPDDERQRLHELAQQYPSYFVLVDLRGAGQPLRAWIKLRSLTAVLEAVAAGDAAGLRVTDRVDAGVPSLVSVRFEGREYSVPVDVDGRNPIAFGVLSRVYQMAVAELATPAVPPITIAK